MSLAKTCLDVFLTSLHFANVGYMAALSEFQMIELIAKAARSSQKGVPSVGRSGGAVQRRGLSGKLRGSEPERVLLGIGDDAAVLQVGGERLVVSVDACGEGVHFERNWLNFADLGFKATQAALSDLAAMGAQPLGFTSALMLPEGLERRELSALVRGQVQAGKGIGCPLIGGNIARSKAFSITTTVLGTVSRIVPRSGARIGDEVWLIGSVGMAALGLELLRRASSASKLRARRSPGGSVVAWSSSDPFERRAVQAWRRPKALISEGERLVSYAHALIDVSDGLGQDVGHIAAASGVKLVLDEVQLRATCPRQYAAQCKKLQLDPLRLCLNGGEDYALVATGPHGKKPAFARIIGVVEAGRGTWLRREDGKLQPIGTGGFEHFSGRLDT